MAVAIKGKRIKSELVRNGEITKVKKRAVSLSTTDETSGSSNSHAAINVHDKIRGIIGKIFIVYGSDKPENHLTSFEKMEIVNSGISKTGLEQLKSKTTLDYDRLAKMLSTTKVTLINKKGEEKYSTALSEKILSIADIYSYGYEVFEDEERFNNWMLSPIRALGGKAPYEIMDNQFGREEVKNIIGRIAYGVYS